MKNLASAVLFFCSLLFLGCGGGDSGSSKTTSTPETATTTPTSNQAPEISMVATQTVESGSSTTLNASISDPEGDSFTVQWQTDATNVIFSNADKASTAVAFPYSDVDIELVISLVATDSKGNASQHTLTVTVKAEGSPSIGPIITLPEAQQATGGESIVISASVQDPQGEDISVEWQADDSEIVFSDTRSLTPTVSLPEVDTTMTATLTLVATDSRQNQSEKSLILTIEPDNDESTATVHIELLNRFDTLSGDVTTLTAKLSSSDDIKKITWDMSALDVTDSATTQTTVNGVTTAKITFTAPSVTQPTEFPIQIQATANNTTFSESTKLYVSANSSDILTVALPSSIVVDENTNTTITPTIESSRTIDSYQWQWLSDQALTLNSPNAKILSLSVPNVYQDIKGQLSLTVTMGSLSKTVITELTIKNNFTVSDVSMTASRALAVKGQKVSLNVHTDDFDQINSWSWEIFGTPQVDVSKNKHSLEFIAPNVSGQQSLSVTYKATLANGSEVIKTAYITIISELKAKSSFDFSFGQTIDVYKGVEKTFVTTFSDPHKVIDTMSLSYDFTNNDFDKAEITRNGDQVTITLKVDAFYLDFDHSDFIQIAVAFGDFKEKYPIRLEMKID